MFSKNQREPKALMLPSRLYGSILILFAACGYATLAIFGKWIFAAKIPMYTALSWRFGIAAVFLWVWLRLRNHSRLTLKKRISCLCLGIMGDALQTTLFFLSIERVGASLAALLLYTFPFFVFFIQFFFFKQIPSRMQWIGLALAFSGVILSVNPAEIPTMHPAYWHGILFGLGAGLVDACYLAFGAYFTKNIPSPIATAHITMGAFATFLFLSLTRGEWMIPFTATEWSLAISMGLVATVLPLLCLVKGMQLIGAVQTSLLFTIEPVATIALAIFFFNESLTPMKLIACVLILSSAIFIQRVQMPGFAKKQALFLKK